MKRNHFDRACLAPLISSFGRNEMIGAKRPLRLRCTEASLTGNGACGWKNKKSLVKLKHTRTTKYRYKAAESCACVLLSVHNDLRSKADVHTLAYFSLSKLLRISRVQSCLQIKNIFILFHISFQHIIYIIRSNNVNLKYRCQGDNSWKNHN